MRLTRALACLGLAAACATGGRRPRFGAVPEATVLLMKKSADSAVVLLDARARALGLAVTQSARREGYVETGWWDLARGRPAEAPFTRLDSIVRYRFFVDPSQGKTRLLAECVRRVAWDPSLPERDLERAVPAGHPGLALLDSMLVVVREDTTRAVPKP